MQGRSGQKMHRSRKKVPGEPSQSPGQRKTVCEFEEKHPDVREEIRSLMSALKEEKHPELSEEMRSLLSTLEGLKSRKDMQGGYGQKILHRSRKKMSGEPWQSRGQWGETVCELEEEHSEVIEEIMSLEKEREDLLHNLTPSLCHYNKFSPPAATWKKENMASVSHKASLHHELADYLDSIVDDVADIGQRMLSMAHVINEPGASMNISSYKTDELVNRTSRLMHISEKFYEDTKKKNYEDYYYYYDDDEEEKDASTMESLKRVMGFHQEIFANHRACWERVWGSNIGRCGGFKDTTSLCAMHFTHYTPATFPSPAAALRGSTLQIYSIKIRKLEGDLNWPLKVSGVVAARDTVDRNRNILFSRSGRNYQVLTEDDPFLRLTGPSRAILAVDPVDFEVKLKINTTSMNVHKSYYASGSTPLFFHCPGYAAELSIGRLAGPDTTPLQATIVGVRVVEGVWPFKHGCRVVCFSSAAADVSGTPTPNEVVLLDYRGKIMRVGSDGYLHLSRNVVSVEFNGRIRVAIHAYSNSGSQAQGDHVDFPAQHCQTSKGKLSVGNSKLEIVVAWSLLVKEKLDLLVDCPAQPPAVEGFVA